MKHIADIPLPNAVRTLVDLALASIGRGLRELMHRYGEPDAMRASNAGAFADVGQALAIVRRLGRLLRFVLVILALRIATPTPREMKTVKRASTIVHERLPAFAVAPPWRPFRDEDARRAQLAAFAATTRQPMLTLARKIEALSRALRAALPLVRRMAARLARDLVVVKRLPKRAPKLKAFWEEFVGTRGQAAFDLTVWRRWRGYANSS